MKHENSYQNSYFLFQYNLLQDKTFCFKPIVQINLIGENYCVYEFQFCCKQVYTKATYHCVEAFFCDPKFIKLNFL